MFYPNTEHLRRVDELKLQRLNKAEEDAPTQRERGRAKLKRNKKKEKKKNQQQSSARAVKLAANFKHKRETCQHSRLPSM